MSEPLTRLFRVEVDGPKAGNPLWWEVRVALHDHPLVTVGTLHPPPQHEGDGPPLPLPLIQSVPHPPRGPSWNPVPTPASNTS